MIKSIAISASVSILTTAVTLSVFHQISFDNYLESHEENKKNMIPIENRIGGLEQNFATLSTKFDELSSLRRTLVAAINQQTEIIQFKERMEAQLANAMGNEKVNSQSLLDSSQAAVPDNVNLADVVNEIIEDRQQLEFDARIAASEQAAQDAELFSNGPYGDHNFQVNNIASKLNLSVEQEDYYYQLLADYSKQSQEMVQGLSDEINSGALDNSQVQSALQQLLTHEEDFNRSLEEEFSTVLDQRQLDTYQNLPLYERGVGNNYFFAQSDFE